MSQQTSNRPGLNEWRQEVRDFVENEWGCAPPFEGDVSVGITYYFKGEALDVDNMPKPILDALNGLVYRDDSQVTDLVCRKRDRDRDLEFADPSPALLNSLAQSEKFLHIKVTEALSMEVPSW